MKLRMASREEVEWVAKEIGYSPTLDAKGLIGEDEEGGIGTCALYDHWTPSSVNMHAYSRGPKYILDPGFDFAIFDYPFREGNKMVAITITPCDNTPSLAVAKYLGFVEVARIRDGWKPGTDMVIQELRRENCRFLGVITEKLSDQVH